MEAVSSAKIWREKAVDTEQMKDLVQGAISATSVIHLPRSVSTLHQNVIMYRHRDTWLQKWMCICLHIPSVSRSWAAFWRKYIH